MQQFFKSLALLFAGGLTSIGGFVAARFVPELEAVSASELPETASFFTDTPSGPSSALDPAAADWFQTPATQPQPVGTTPTNPDAVPRVVLGGTQRDDVVRTAEVARTSLGQPAANLFGSVSSESVPQQPSAFASTPQTTTAPSAPVGFGEMEPVANPTTFGHELRDTQPGPLFGTAAQTTSAASVAPTTPAADGQTNMTWDEAIERLSELGATDYRLVPIEDGRLRCDVWILDGSTGSQIRRQYSAEGGTPAAAATNVASQLNRTTGKPASPQAW